MRTVQKFLIFVLASGFLFACTESNQSVQFSGITRVVPRGIPPAQIVIWSPQEDSKVLVTASEPGFGAEVYILDTGTGQKKILAKTESGTFYESAWSAGGKDVLIFIGDNAHEYEPRGWWKVNIDSGLSQYIMGMDDVITWSPNGKTTVSLGGTDLYFTDLDTRASEVIDTHIESISGFEFAWSPDSQNLIFVAGQSSSNLYNLDLNTRQIAKIIEDGNTPAWSPKGKIIAFAKSTVDYSNTIHLVTSDGKCEIELPDVKNVLSLTWSPNGRKIAFVGEDGIYVLDIDIVARRNIYKSLCEE